jgi:hypothetical protein
MNCYVCSLRDRTTEAVGVCRHCGAALCAVHLREALAYATGGMAYACPHLTMTEERPEREQAGEPSRTAAP